MYSQTLQLTSQLIGRLGLRLRARAERGQGMVEYALILVMVSVVVIVILITQGATMVNMFSNITTSLKTDAHM